MDYKCEICGAEFYHKPYLTKHQSRLHGIKSRHVNKEFSCIYCQKRFSSKPSLSRHRINIHDVKKSTISCQEEKCDKKFRLLSELRDHLMHEHDFKNMNNCQNLEFDQNEDFHAWLAEEEKCSNSKYSLSSGKTKNKCTYKTFSCNRSGFYKQTIEDRKRRLKAQGTIKLGFHCTSSIQVREIDSKVLVSFYKEHYKHGRNLGHLPIPNADKEAIAYTSQKHINFLSLSLDAAKNFTGPISNLDDSVSIAESSCNNKINQHKLNKLRIKFLSAKLNSLHDMEESVACQINHHLNALQHLMQITGEKILEPQIAKSEPNNKKILKQKRFHSVKKPRSRKKVKLSNPSYEEAKVCSS